ncbi:MAG: alpha-L-fucosidase, partial [bacterium]
GMTMHKQLMMVMAGMLLTGASAWAAENDAAQRRTDWFKGAQWGVSTRYLTDAGMSAEEWNKRVDAFDVPGLVKQLEATGCRYYVITLGQNSGHFCSPNAAYDKYAGIQPSKCSKRDLVKDIHAALAPKGIKLMLYLPCQAPNADPVAQKGFGLPQGAKDQPIDEAFAKKWAEVIQEWSKRYGTNVVGWWFDGGWHSHGFNEAIARSYADAVRSGNPDSIATFNSGVGMRKGTDTEDYTAGEIDRDAAWVECDGRWLDGKQWHMLSYLGSWWGAGPPRFPDEAVIEMTRNIIKNEGVVTWDVPIQLSGLIPEPFVKQLTAVREGLTKPAAPIKRLPPGNLAYRNKRTKLLDVTGTKELAANGGNLCAKNGVDGDATTQAQASDEWSWTYHVDLGAVHPLNRVVIAFDKDGFATEYKVKLSADGLIWTTVAHVKDATGGKPEHTFAATTARYVRIQALKPDGPNQKGQKMAVLELEVYQDLLGGEGVKEMGKN